MGFSWTKPPQKKVPPPVVGKTLQDKFKELLAKSSVKNDSKPSS